MNSFKITIKPTRNPSILKFEANSFLVKQNGYEYANIDQAGASPLAQQLFYLPFVKTVYISGNFVAIEKYDIASWNEVQEALADSIEEYLNSGRVAVMEPETTSIPITCYAESTPNPAVMKFVANKKLVLFPVECKGVREADGVPLAQALFRFPYVKEVFIDGNYVSIIKTGDVDWNEVMMELREFLTNYLGSGGEVVSPTYPVLVNLTKGRNAQIEEGLDETSQQIIAILEEYVKPAVASDGGNIVFDSYDETEKTVKVILQGACNGCPSSTYTLKSGIETMLKTMLQDKVVEVIALNG